VADFGRLRQTSTCLMSRRGRFANPIKPHGRREVTKRILADSSSLLVKTSRSCRASSASAPPRGYFMFAPIHNFYRSRPPPRTTSRVVRAPPAKRFGWGLQLSEGATLMRAGRCSGCSFLLGCILYRAFRCSLIPGVPFACCKYAPPSHILAVHTPK